MILEPLSTRMVRASMRALTWCEHAMLGRCMLMAFHARSWAAACDDDDKDDDEDDDDAAAATTTTKTEASASAAAAAAPTAAARAGAAAAAAASSSQQHPAAASSKQLQPAAASCSQQLSARMWQICLIRHRFGSTHMLKHCRIAHRTPILDSHCHYGAPFAMGDDEC